MVVTHILSSFIRSIVVSYIWGLVRDHTSHHGLELEARGHVYLAQREELQKLVKAVQLDIKSVTELSREKLVATLQDWLTEVRGQEGGGQKTYQAVVKILQKSTPQPVKTQVEEPRTQVTVPEGPKKASVETVKLTVSEKPNMRVQKQFKIRGEVDRAGISFASVNPNP